MSAEETVQVEVDRLAKESFPLDDRDPERSVPSMEEAVRHPLQMGYFVMLLIERGDAAMAKKDYPAAIKYYRAMTKAVPERAKSFALLCQAYEGAGQAAKARESCREALGKGGVTVDDNLRFVRLTLDKKGPLESAEVEDVKAIIAHLDSELKEDRQRPLLIERMRCDLATRLEDIPALEACSAVLHELAPGDARTIGFRWALALGKRDFPKAESILTDAREHGLPHAALAKMEESLATQRGLASSGRGLWSGQSPLVFGIGLLLAALGYVFVRLRRSLSLP